MENPHQGQPPSFPPPMPADHVLPEHTVKPDKELPPVGTFFTDVFTTYREHTISLLGVALIPALLTAILSIFNVEEGGMPLSTFFGFLENTYGTNYAILGMIFFFVTALLHVLVHLLLSPATAGILEYGHDPLEAASKAGRKVFSYLWLTILMNLIVILGYVLLIVPGIIAQIWFSIVFILAAIEGKKGIEALARSRAYVQGRWVPVALRYFLVVALTLLFSAVVSTGMAVLTAGLSDLPALFLYTFVVTWFASSFIAVTTYTLYKHLAATRDLHDYAVSEREKKFLKGAAAFGLLIVLTAVVVLGVTMGNAYRSGELDIKQELRKWLERSDSRL